MAELSGFEVDEKGRPRSVAEIVTSGGTRIYLLPVETFPGHLNNLYLIDHPSGALLFDVGTRPGHPELLRRFAELERFGVRTRLQDVRWALISHAHIDHFGNARALRDAGAEILIHELDARVLGGFQERLLLAARDLGVWLHRAGLRPERVDRLLDLYRAGKDWFEDLTPDRCLRGGDRVGPGWPLLHVPGHCPGLVCLAVDDVVLTGDHVLSRITPAQSPHAITAFMGLESYLRSLERLRGWSPPGAPFALALGAHEAPVPCLSERIDQIEAHHAARLERVLELLDDGPATVADLAQELFGRQRGYGVLLALFEAGAHLEFLHDLGDLAVENLDEVAVNLYAPTVYRRRADR